MKQAALSHVPPRDAPSYTGATALRNRYKQFAAAMIGNVLEYYDFIIYAYLATTLARKFFVGDEATALLASFATFGVGFLARPLGGAVFGWVADKFGRRVALQATVFGMAGGTFGIGLLPDYATAGLAAPALLVALRLFQGLAAGGEWGTATTFIVESAPAGGRGFFGGLNQASVAAALLLSSFVATALNVVFTQPEIDAWAWRVPFLLGSVLLAVGVYMRRNLSETPAFENAKARSTGLPKTNAAEAVRQMLTAFGLTVVWTVSYYLMLSYMPTFLAKHAGLTTQQALASNTIGLVVLVVTMPLCGRLSDRVGRKPLLLTGSIALALITYPLFSLVLLSKSFAVCIAVQIVFNLFISAFSGAAPAALCELFPTANRTTFLSIGYSVSVAVFGGFAPFIATWLIGSTGSPISPGYYLIAAAVLSTLFIARMRETAHQEIK